MYFNFQSCQFEEKTTRPNKLALIGSDGEKSWNEVSQLVGQITQAIESLSLKKGYPIFIYGHKETAFPISILACLSANHPFVPIDKLYPTERINEIQEETNSSVFIDCTGTLSGKNKTFIQVIGDKVIVENGEIRESWVPVYDQNPLAYILFTSGSTGKPKGVLIRQSSILDLVKWVKSDAFRMSEQDVFVNQSPFSFDVSLFDTFASFTYGASMILVSQELSKNSDEFFKVLRNYKATFWTSTPAFIYMYLRESWFNSFSLKHLRSFVFAGEPLPISTCESLYDNFSNPNIYNAYGPTEATVITTLLKVEKELFSSSSSLPIGYSKPESKMITEKSEATRKTPSELIIIGENVAEGYLNRPEETKEKFFQIDGKKAYKTGDLGFIEEGLIYCLGRNDNQIKLNGYRIELDEINEKLLGYPFINESRTIGLKRQDKVVRIVCMIQSDEVLDMASLKENLLLVLPHYMVPSDFLQINAFPTNQSGKID